MNTEEERYRFIAEWYDPSVKVKREFLLTFFPSDVTVEMFDLQLKRLFLKRIRCENVDAGDMFVGNAVNIFSRQLFITDFGDQKTKEKFSRDSEITVGFIMDSGFDDLGRILDVISQNDITVNKGRMMKAHRNQLTASELSQILPPKFVVLELRGENVVGLWEKLLGINNNCGKMLKAELGPLSRHCLHVKSEKTLTTELQVFFPVGREIHCNTSIVENSTCCIIKPHAVREGNSGKIIQDIIDEGYQITALEYINFDLPTASEFYEVYKGVVPYYQEMVGQLISGMSVALEITKGSEREIVKKFREFAGPSDAELAKKLRPMTLRARYGLDKIKNAVHCTDLADDGRLEVEYLFRVLACS